jgi:hypothetical protein
MGIMKNWLANKTNEKKILFSFLLFIFFIFCSSFFLFYKQSFFTPGKLYGPDLKEHIQLTAQYFSHQTYFPHAGIHTICYYFSRVTGISLQYSFILILSLCVVAIGVAIFLILRNFLREYYSSGFVLLLTFLSLFVSAIYISFFNKNVILPQGSPNVWHNPTLIAIKPFAFIAFMLMISFFIHSEYQNKFKYFFLIAGTLLLCNWIKPNFVLSFLPAMAIWILITYPRRWILYLKSLALVLPCIIYLAIQYSTTYTEDSIIFDFLGVMKLYSPNPYFSLFLGTAFPSLLILFRFKKVFKNPYFLVSFFNLVIAILQMIFLAEWPHRYRHFNFFWGYLIALQITFIFSEVEFFKWWAKKNKSISEYIKIWIVSIALGLHFLSGLYYMVRIWSGIGWR